MDSTQATRALAHFERWYDAQDLTPNERVYGESRARMFFDWLPRWYPDPADRETIFDAWDAAEEARVQAVEDAERAAEAAELARQAQYLGIDQLTDGERAQFLSWIARCSEQEGRLHPPGSAVVWFRADKAVSEWRLALAWEGEQAAEADREEEERRAERKQKETAQRLVEEKEARDRVATQLADLAWMRGEDAISLRAVAAWRLANKLIDFTVSDATVKSSLATAIRTLQEEIQTRANEIQRATGRDAAERLLREERGEPPIRIPAPFDLTALVDVDTVARWLVAHEGQYDLVVGRYVPHTWTDSESGEPRTGRRLERPGDWDQIKSRCASWTVALELQRKAADAQPADAETFRELALKVVAGQVATGSALADKVEGERIMWDLRPDEPEPELKRAKAAPPRADGPPIEAIMAAVERFQKTHRGPRSEHRGDCCSANQLHKMVGGKRGPFDATLSDLVQEGELENIGTGTRPCYAVKEP